MDGPNLSEYFRNDAPSMFDEIVPATTPANTISTEATGKSDLANGIKKKSC